MDRQAMIFEEINHCIVKEIDFIKDIEVEMSDSYEIDQELGCLRFMYKELKKVEKADDYICILGKRSECNGLIKLTAEKAESLGDSVYLANMIIKGSAFTKDIDRIHLQFDKPDYSAISLGIINSDFYDILMKMSKKELPLDAKYYTKNGTKRLKIECFYNSLAVSNSKRHKMLEGYSTTIDHKDKIDEVTFDVSEKQLILNNVKYPIPVADGIIENQICINIIGFIEKDRIINGNTDFLIRSLAYLKKEGYIYLKPIKTECSRVKAFIAYSGSPAFEVYSGITGEWIEITNDKEICEKTVKLRARMNCGDKIYRIVLAEI